MERKEELEKLKKDELVELLLSSEAALASAVVQAQENAVKGDEAVARVHGELEVAIANFEAEKAVLKAQIEETEKRAAKGEEALGQHAQIGELRKLVETFRDKTREEVEAQNAADHAHRATKSALNELANFLR